MFPASQPHHRSSLARRWNSFIRRFRSQSQPQSLGGPKNPQNPRGVSLHLHAWVACFHKLCIEHRSQFKELSEGERLFVDEAIHRVLFFFWVVLRPPDFARFDTRPPHLQMGTSTPLWHHSFSGSNFSHARSSAWILSSNPSSGRRLDYLSLLGDDSCHHVLVLSLIQRNV